MWILKPYIPPKPLSVDLPFELVQTLGDGVSLLVSFLEDLSRAVIENRDSVPSPPLALCRVCERYVPTWWFERHSEICVVEHKIQSDLDSAHENLVDQRNTIVHLLGMMDSKPPGNADSPSSSPNSVATTNSFMSSSSISSVSSRTSSSSTTSTPKLEYRGIALPAPHLSPSSETSSPPRSPRVMSQLGSSSSKRMLLKSFNLPKRSPIKLMELLLELCDLAVEINSPEIRSDGLASNAEVRIHSPQSESRIHRVLNWVTPHVEDQGMLLLCEDTVKYARQKVDAAMRLGNTITYFETIRHETERGVSAAIEDTVEKATLQRAHDESIYESVEEQGDNEGGEEDTDIDDNSSLFSENYLNTDALPSSSTPNSRRPTNLSLRHETSFGNDFSLTDPRSNVGRDGSITPRSLLSDSINPEPNLSRSRLPESRMQRQSTLDANEPLDFQLADLDLNSTSGFGRIQKKKSFSNLSTVSSSSYTGVPSTWTSLQRNRIHTASSETGQSPSTPLSSPLIFPHEAGFPFDPLNHRRQSSVHSDASRAPVSPLLQSTVFPTKPSAPSIKDYEIISPISKGAFGSVYLAKKKITGEYFAIKVLKKADMIAKNQVMNVRAERAIMMSQSDSPFVAKLYFTFQSKNYLYLVMEYLNGGDCAALVKVLGGLPEEWAQKYIAEVVLGVEDLHKKGIVHRDLKPDNLLINQDGHLKLTDFGLSRMGMVGRHTHQPSVPAIEGNASFDSGASGNSKPMVKSATNPEMQSSTSSGSSMSGPTNSNPLLDSTISLVPGYFNLHSKRTSRRPTISRSESNSSATCEALFNGSTFFEPNKHNDDDNMSSNSSEASGSMGSTASAPHSVKQVALFDPSDTSRKFVGTPDYLAPETIRGDGQDEMSDWWSTGCILFEFLYGYPPFHAETPELVFQTILEHKIQWPELDEDLDEVPQISPEARDLIEKLLNPIASERLGARDGADEIRKHPFFNGINWDTLWDEQASFIPVVDDPESTDYFDSRGAESQALPEDVLQDDDDKDDHRSDRSYSEDSKSGRSSRAGSIESNGMTRKDRGAKLPLHIPPHVRDSRNRRLSEPMNDDFGSFAFKNLPMLEKANKDTLTRIKTENLEHRNSMASEPHRRSRGLSISTGAVFKRPDSPSMAMQRNISPVRNHNSTHSAQSSLSLSPNISSISTYSNSPGPPSSSSSVSSPHRKGYSIKPRPSMSITSMSTSPLSIDYPKQMKIPSHTFASNSPTMSPGGSAGPSGELYLPPPGASSSKQQLTPMLPQGLGLRRLSNMESSPELGEQFRKQSASQRYSKVFDPSPSNSDTEEARGSALMRIQKRRQMTRKTSSISLLTPVYRPLVVLICESNPVWRYSMETLLKGLNCRFVSVTDAADAIRYATGDVQFDIIFTEFKFPKTNGADIARILHSTSSCNTETPVVCVTNYATEASNAARSNFSSIILKPPTREKISEALERHCCWKPKEHKVAEGSKESETVQSIPEVVREVTLERDTDADATRSHDTIRLPTFQPKSMHRKSDTADPKEIPFNKPSTLKNEISVDPWESRSVKQVDRRNVVEVQTAPTVPTAPTPLRPFISSPSSLADSKIGAKSLLTADIDSSTTTVVPSPSVASTPTAETDARPSIPSSSSMTAREKKHRPRKKNGKKH